MFCGWGSLIKFYKSLEFSLLFWKYYLLLFEVVVFGFCYLICCELIWFFVDCVLLVLFGFKMLLFKVWDVKRVKRKLVVVIYFEEFVIGGKILIWLIIGSVNKKWYIINFLSRLV